MSENIPKVVKSGFIKLDGSHELEVHVLDTGQRVISEESLNVFFDWLGVGFVTDEAANALARAIKLGEFSDD